MGEQIHKRLSDEQMRMIMDRYLAGEMNATHAMELLGLKRSQFFEWVQKYRNDPDGFTVAYRRKIDSRRLDEKVHGHILEELAVEKGLINDPSVPIRFYNYSYIQDQLLKRYGEKVSLPAIIERAKKMVTTWQNLTRLFMTMKLSLIT
jgi:hypothetical protein